jgi:Arc/MetJ-type ribon-helix-helix transcriptional regulator
MTTVSVSLDEDLADELRREVSGNVSAFIAEAVRDALDRRRLLRALRKLDEELGELDADRLADAAVLFDEVDAANQRSQAAEDSLEDRG